MRGCRGPWERIAEVLIRIGSELGSVFFYGAHPNNPFSRGEEFSQRPRGAGYRPMKRAFPPVKTGRWKIKCHMILILTHGWSILCHGVSGLLESTSNQKRGCLFRGVGDTLGYVARSTMKLVATGNWSNRASGWRNAC